MSMFFWVFGFIVAICAAVDGQNPPKLRTHQDELKRLPDFPVNDLEKLRKFIKESSDLPKISDLRLIQFHFSSSYNLEKTKELIRNYYNYFKESSNFFEGRSLSDPSVSAIKEVVGGYVSPVRTSDDTQIIMARLTSDDASLFDFDAAIKYFLMAIEAGTQLYGVAKHTELVLDADNISSGHMLKVTFALDSIKRIAEIYQTALPIRHKAIHILNAGSYGPTILEVAQPFVEQKFLDSVKFYSEDELADFQKAVPAKFLPKEYGGSLGSFESLTEKFEASLKVVEPFFAEEEKLVANVK